MLNGGICGFGIGHSDIGGYTTIYEVKRFSYLRDQEMLMRWSEMSAFSDAVYRTHPGLAPTRIAQIWDNPTIA